MYIILYCTYNAGPLNVIILNYHSSAVLSPAVQRGYNSWHAITRKNISGRLQKQPPHADAKRRN